MSEIGQLPTATCAFQTIMLSKLFFLTAFVAFHLLPSTVATPVFQYDRRADTCSSGLVGDLTALLKNYQPAQSFCSANYPCRAAKIKRVATTSTTAAVAVTLSTTSNKAATTTITAKSTTLTSSRATSTPADPLPSALSQLKQKVASTIAAICSCIEVTANLIFYAMPCLLTVSRIVRRRRLLR